jgi:hypothetical protein
MPAKGRLEKPNQKKISRGGEVKDHHKVQQSKAGIPNGVGMEPIMRIAKGLSGVG